MTFSCSWVDGILILYQELYLQGRNSSLVGGN